MAFKLAEAFVEINVKLADLRKQLKKSRSLTKKHMKKTESTVRKAAKRIGLAIAAAFSVRIVGRFIRSVISAGSAVTEMENLYSVTMGKFTASTRIWSDELATSFGRNAFFIRKNVGIFNVMLKSWGIGEEQARDMSQALVRLTHDMSSFWDVEPEEMFFRMRSAMAGLPRVLRRFGVTIDEENVKLAAARMGISRYGTEMTWAQKVQARFTLLMEQTTAAQGDVIRTSHEYANRVRAMQAATKEQMAVAGQAIIAAGALANAWGALTGEIKSSTPIISAAGKIFGWVLGIWIRAAFVIVTAANLIGDAYKFWIDNAKVLFHWMVKTVGKAQELSKSVPVVGRFFEGVDEVGGKPFGRKRVEESEKAIRNIENQRKKSYQAMLDRWDRLADLGMDFWSPFGRGPRTVPRTPVPKPGPPIPGETAAPTQRGIIESSALPGGIRAGMMIGGGDKPASETNQEKMINKLTGIENNTSGRGAATGAMQTIGTGRGPFAPGEKDLIMANQAAAEAKYGGVDFGESIVQILERIENNTAVDEAARVK